ncbi:MAG TPA: alpha-L-fucosidase [Clostridiales bacterium]|jgi:alpha-L-fucosidase|nr:alpha-L-fucosidase [Clostridiales bacterium]
MYYTAKPTEKLLEWQDMELGVLIHYLIDIYKPDCHPKHSVIAEEIPPSSINPSRLDPEQWVICAKEAGAKYAILVAKHCTGFALWPTAENEFSCKYMPWKDGKGDVVGEFIAACKKHRLAPGLYYSTGCNGFYGINDGERQDYKSKKYQAYVGVVERQLTELWSNYGELFEIWFDGGTIPEELGGPAIPALLKKYQPQAVCFQGPEEWENNTRWVGNEDGDVPFDCWAAAGPGGNSFDGTEKNEKTGVGNPNGIFYRPAETDMPNRKNSAFGGGWGWQPGEAHLAFTPEYLLDRYIKSVGRNTNLLLGMAISKEGDFEDEEQFRQFGRLLKQTFGKPLYLCENPELRDGKIDIPAVAGGKYLVLREDISEGQRIRGYSLTQGDKTVFSAKSLGNKRIIPIDREGGATLAITESDGRPALREIAVY